MNNGVNKMVGATGATAASKGADDALHNLPASQQPGIPTGNSDPRHIGILSTGKNDLLMLSAGLILLYVLFNKN